MFIKCKLFYELYINMHINDLFTNYDIFDAELTVFANEPLKIEIFPN